MIFIIMINNRYRLSLQRFQDSKIPIRRYYKPVSDRRVHPPTNGQTVETFASNRDRDRYFGSIYIYIPFIDPILTSSRNCSPFRAAYLERNRDFEHVAAIIFILFIFRLSPVSVHETTVSQSIGKEVVNDEQAKKTFEPDYNETNEFSIIRPKFRHFLFDPNWKIE